MPQGLHNEHNVYHCWTISKLELPLEGSVILREKGQVQLGIGSDCPYRSKQREHKPAAVQAILYSSYEVVIKCDAILYRINCYCQGDRLQSQK